MSIFNSDLEPEEISSLLKEVKRIRFVGVLGAGMYPLARLLAARGYFVSGSDTVHKGEPCTDEYGIRVESSGGMSDADLAVYSLAIDEDDPEILCARANGIPLVSRAQLLGAIMRGYELGISVSGSHGKSTTTAVIDSILSYAGIPHTTVSGATLSSGTSLYDGGGDVFLAEACEYKDSFLRLRPTYQLITSVELDHTDYFTDIEMLRASFLRAANRAKVLVVNLDDPIASDIARELRDGQRDKRIIGYGKSANADYRIVSVTNKGDVTQFTVAMDKRELSLNTSLIGEFNLYNLTAAIAVTDSLGVPLEAIVGAIRHFTPIDRRMSLITKIDGTPVYYDYAHHPSEIEATIGALKERYGTLTVIFRPHTYSRTKSLWGDFIRVLCKADFTILLDIYPARERYIDGVDSSLIASEIPGALYVTQEEAATVAASKKVGAIALIGAGEVERVKADLIKLGKKEG